MKTSLFALFIGILAGGFLALSLNGGKARAASCTCTASFSCSTDFEGVANAGQAQNCCSAPSIFPTDKLKFTITRKETGSCGKDKLIRTSTGGSTCSIGSEMQPQPTVGVSTCWDSGTPRSHTETYHMQRCCDNDDGTLTVEVKETGGNQTVCATITGTFDSNQTALCSNCTNPGDCHFGMCSTCQ